MSDWLERHAKVVLIACILVSAIYGIWMISIGSPVWIVNFASGAYCIHVLVKWWRYM